MRKTGDRRFNRQEPRLEPRFGNQPAVRGEAAATSAEPELDTQTESYLRAMEIMRERERAEGAEAARAYQAEIVRIRQNGSLARWLSFFGMVVVGLAIWAFGDGQAALGYYIIFAPFWVLVAIFAIPIGERAAEAALTPEGRNALLIANMVGLVGLFRR